VIDTRLATCEDIEQLCSILQVLFSSEVEFIPNRAKQENGLKMIIENQSIGEIFVACRGEKIIAMVNLLYSVSTALGERVAILEDMIVLEEFREEGVGSKLIEHAIQYANIKGCKRVTLLSDDTNLKAHRFYEKQGFKKSTMLPFRLFL
jgi:GNAT superfamily N-acetyltransferase